MATKIRPLCGGRRVNKKKFDIFFEIYIRIEAFEIVGLTKDVENRLQDRSNEMDEDDKREKSTRGTWRRINMEERRKDGHFMKNNARAYEN